jgi:ABC-2 type transport system ATP-binding protein
MKLVMMGLHDEEKKLALAAALLLGPSLPFLDEPFEGVDAVSSRVLEIVCSAGAFC